MPKMGTVVIRSHKRISYMLEIVDVCLKQDYPNFEVLIIEQSEEQREQYRAQLEELKRDQRVRIYEYGSLGPSRARNEAVKHARGEILVFVDDDDLPLGTEWLSSHMANFDDDLCIASSGRQVLSTDEDPTPFNTEKNRRNCLRYTFFKMPQARVRHTARVVGITAIHGTNSAIRKSAIQRAGGWDEEEDHEEDSFAFKYERLRKPGEYFVYDPKPVILRQMDIPGGVGRRDADEGYVLKAELNYSHNVVRRFYPGRFYAFYPVFIYLALKYSVRHMKKFHPGKAVSSYAFAFLKRLPSVWLDVVRNLKE
jgi:glycosyltransferase involved in cell wall biosynthesis